MPYTDVEVERGVCPVCNVPVEPPLGPKRDAAPPARAADPAPRGGGRFWLGLFVGCLAGPAVWAALRLGVPSPGVGDGQAAALEAARSRQAESDEQANRAEAGRRSAEAARAEAVKALEAARREATAAGQKGDTERRLRDALDRLAEEKNRRAFLEAALAAERKARAEPGLASVRDWQLLGPFASKPDQGHDTVYPPEREPVRLEKPYDGSGGPVRWRPYHSAEDKIDLAAFFKYHQAGAAYAVTWAMSDADRDVTLAVGSDDGVRLWVNGQKVHDVKGGRQARPRQDLVKARLRKGWNEIRAKVDNIAGTWELYLEFLTADGRQPLPMTTTSTPPPARK